MNREEYSQYLWSPSWRLRRKLLIYLAGAKCEKCGCESDVPNVYPVRCNVQHPLLHVHHKHYDNVGSERPEDVEVLCFVCHGERHPDKPPMKWPRGLHCFTIGLGLRYRAHEIEYILKTYEREEAFSSE